jgi:hypothetical protein
MLNHPKRTWQQRSQQPLMTMIFLMTTSLIRLRFLVTTTMAS